MTKKYLLSEDKFSGQVVVVCTAEEVEYKHWLTEEELRYSCDNSLYHMVKRMLYTVKAYYHYEEAETREERCLFNEHCYDNKDMANEIFRQAVKYMLV